MTLDISLGITQKLRELRELRELHGSTTTTMRTLGVSDAACALAFRSVGELVKLKEEELRVFLMTAERRVS